MRLLCKELRCKSASISYRNPSVSSTGIRLEGIESLKDLSSPESDDDPAEGLRYADHADIFGRRCAGIASP